MATYGRDAKALLKELQSQNERMFLVTFLVLNTGRTEQELENNVFQASSIAQKHNCNLCRLDFQQEQGLMSSLPLADCQIEIQRGLTTSSTAIFIPFTTQELYQSGKESLYYGLNALSNNLIMVDRKKLKNPNGLILGTPGSGKSFSAKREITNAFLVTDDDIIICDPEAEYAPLVERLHGQVIHIGPASTQYINPMDINSNYSEEDNPLALKADFILSLCELVVGGKEGLQPVEKTVIDRCVHVVYRKYFENPTPENMPLLEVQSAQVAVVLLGNGAGLKDVVFQLLFRAPGVQHQKGDEKHPLVLALQFFQQGFCIPAIGCQIGRNNVNIIPGTDCLFLLLNLAAIQFRDGALDRLDGTILVNGLWCCTIKVDIGNSKGQYEKDKQEVTKDGSESTKIQHGI